MLVLECSCGGTHIDPLAVAVCATTRLEAAKERAAAWKALSELQDKMLACFRLQKNPGSLIDKIYAARDRVEKLEAADGR